MERLKQALEVHRELVKLRAGECSVQKLFSMGCGFTGFLRQMFCHLSFEEMLSARLVCTKWKEFIDNQVWYEHPSIVWLLQQFPEILGHSGGDLASSLRYLKILSLRSTFPPLRKKKMVEEKKLEQKNKERQNS